MGRLDTHPSGLDFAELGYASMGFWKLPDNSNLSIDAVGTWSEPGVWERLLAFQQGWNACKEFNRLDNE